MNILDEFWHFMIFYTFEFWPPFLPQPIPMHVPIYIGLNFDLQGISTVTHVTFSFRIEVVETYIFKTWIAKFFFMCEWMTCPSILPDRNSR